MEIVVAQARSMSAQKTKRNGAHHDHEGICRDSSRGRRMEAKKARNDRDERDPEQGIIVESDRCAISPGQSEDQIMMVAPEDCDDKETERVGG